MDWMTLCLATGIGCPLLTVGGWFALLAIARRFEVTAADLAPANEEPLPDPLPFPQLTAANLGATGVVIQRWIGRAVGEVLLEAEPADLSMALLTYYDATLRGEMGTMLEQLPGPLSRMDHPKGRPLAYAIRRCGEDLLQGDDTAPGALAIRLRRLFPGDSEPQAQEMDFYVPGMPAPWRASGPLQWSTWLDAILAHAEQNPAVQAERAALAKGELPPQPTWPAGDDPWARQYKVWHYILSRVGAAEDVLPVGRHMADWIGKERLFAGLPMSGPDHDFGPYLDDAKLDWSIVDPLLDAWAKEAVEASLAAAANPALAEVLRTWDVGHRNRMHLRWPMLEPIREPVRDPWLRAVEAMSDIEDPTPVQAAARDALLHVIDGALCGDDDTRWIGAFIDAVAQATGGDPARFHDAWQTAHDAHPA